MIFVRLRPVAFLFVLSLMAGCRSEQVAFRFTTPPNAGYGASARTSHAVAVEASKPATPNEAPAVASGALAAAAVTVAPARKSFGRSVRTYAQHSLTMNSLFRSVAAPEAPVQLRAHRRAAGALAHTQRTAEAGLGRVALFFIGVVLAVLAGLAALVNLVFGVGFFTALGYTAAGLVVLYLLYNLFSPKKTAKKKA